MGMPVSERRLNLKFIMEHLDKVREVQEQARTVTANKPLVSKPPVPINEDSKPTYTTVAKSKK